MWVKKFTDWLDTSAAADEHSGDGAFFMFTERPASRAAALRRAAPWTGAGVATLVLLAVLAAAGASAATLAIMALLCALLAFALRERSHARAWQKQAAAQLEKMAGLHDRLVRETARTRADLTTLKEGLSQTASAAARAQPRAAGSSAEAHMIEAIVAQLSSLGEKPPALLEHHATSQILELEMNPPPRDTASGEYSPSARTTDAMILAVIDQAVRNDAIDVFLQPVVSLPQRKLRLFEMFARLRDGHGTHLSASHYLPLAQARQMTPAIDNLLLLRCLQMLRRSAGETNATPFVLNISGATLADAGFMGDLLAFLSENRTMAARLIFELTQAEIEDLPKNTAAVLDGLDKLGCRFSMDGVRQRRLDLALLRARHIRYIKLDAAWLVREGQQRNGPAKIARFKQQLDSAGIDLIVERVENDATLHTILDYNIDFGQGYLFGKPDAAATWLMKQKA